MKKFLMAAVAVLTTGSAHAQSVPAITVAPNISSPTVIVAPKTNVATQVSVAPQINVSPSIAVATSVFGNAIAKANTITFQNNFGTLGIGINNF